jgi:hypothetical protein
MVSRYTLMSSAFIRLPIIFSQSIFFLAFMTRRDDNHDNIHFNFHAGRQRQGVAFSYVIVSKLLISVVDFFFLLASVFIRCFFFVVYLHKYLWCLPMGSCSDIKIGRGDPQHRMLLGVARSHKDSGVTTKSKRKRNSDRITSSPRSQTNCVRRICGHVFSLVRTFPLGGGGGPTTHHRTTNKNVRDCA